MRVSKKRLMTNCLAVGRFCFGLTLCCFSSAWAQSDNSDDIIILQDAEIETENGKKTDEEKRASILKDIKDRAFIRTNTFVRGEYQLTQPEERPIRVLGSAWVTAGLSPADYLMLQLSLIGRVPVDFSWQSYPPQPTTHVGAFIDFYDTFLKLQFSNLTLYVGDLLVPWVSIRGAAILDRLNPIDYRRGPNFTADISGRIPQWGALFRSSIFETSIDGVLLFEYTPNKGSLVASDQGGVAIARYQGALMPNQMQIGDLLPRDRSRLEAETPLFQTPSLALRVRRQLGDLVDAGFNVNWGFNEVPSLVLNDKVSRFLADRYFADTSLAPSFAAWPCADAPYSSRELLDTCLGPTGMLSHRRVLGFGLDASMNLGAVVLKGEGLVEPAFGSVGGKTTILVSKDAMRSTELTSLTLAVAADGEYGDWFTGSVEIFDTMWFNVPANEHVLGVESLHADVSTVRSVHRLALAAAIEGTFFSKTVAWRLKGEAGILQPDLLATFDAHHNWQSLGLSLGGYANIFAGIDGSPGWFRRNATAFGVYVRHEL